MAARTLEPEKFTGLLLEKSEGNFTYLYHVLQDIESGEFQEFRPEDLPRGLRDYYRRHWQAMVERGRELFDKVYEPVLCVLGAVREAVSEEQLVEWTGLGPGQVRRVIRDCHEFLDEERGPDGCLYRIYHASFRHYLQEVDVVPRLEDVLARIARASLDEVGKRKDRKA
jgi:hypothetical protein